MKTMKVLVCEQPTELRYRQRPLPVAAAGEAVIKMIAVGICGTDIHAWSGQQPFFSYPRVLGHEICAEIVSLGDQTAGWRVGQRVAVIPYLSCRRCGACLSGKTNCCENISVIGVHQDGAFCEYLSVPAGNLLAVDDVAPEAAALIEPFAISAHAVRRAALSPDEHLLVVGAGPIGLGVAAIAQATARGWWWPTPAPNGGGMSNRCWGCRRSIRRPTGSMRRCAGSLTACWRLK